MCFGRFEQLALQFSDSKSLVVEGRLLQMREDDLSGEDGVVVGDVRIWESRTVLEFDLQTFSEILQPDLLGFAADLLENRSCFLCRYCERRCVAPILDPKALAGAPNLIRSSRDSRMSSSSLLRDA